MSDMLRQATIAALKKAYAGYLDRDWECYQTSLSEARKKIDIIRSLGHDPDRMGRELEVLYLTGEELLITAFTFVGRPYEMRMYYELAEYHMIVLPSKILTKDAAYLPPDVDLLKLFPFPEEDPEEAEKEFTEAMDIYHRITGGGDGVDMLYRAAIAFQMEDIRRAEKYLEQARASGGMWILPHTEWLEERIRKRQSAQ